MTTQKTREDQLRRDARRIGMTIQKGRCPIGEERPTGFMVIDDETNAAVFGAEHFPYSATFEECEIFIRDHAKAVGAMADDGRWLVDRDGDLIDE